MRTEARGVSSACELGFLLQTRRAGTIDLAVRFGADLLFTPAVDLEVEDRSISRIWLGNAVLALSQRDQVHLLGECRRVLLPGGNIALPESTDGTVFDVLARKAELMGLIAVCNDGGAPGWRKQFDLDESQPLVSIVIPSSNPKYFAECLDSAIAQTYAHTEIIVSDDCETNAIQKIFEARQDGVNCRYVKNPVRLRARKNFEQCLALASGTYVKFLNDDDLLEPTCIETLLGAFLSVPDLVLATSHRWRIDESSSVIEDMPATVPITTEDVVVEGTSLANAVIMHGLNFIGEPSTAMFRKRDFEPRPHLQDVSPFNFDGEEVRGAVDLAMWSRLLVQGNAAFFANRLSRFRIHSEQAQARTDVLERSVQGIRNLQAKWIELGLFRAMPPHLLRCKSLARSATLREPWRAQPILSFPSHAEPPEAAIKAWRATRRHGFDTLLAPT